MKQITDSWKESMNAREQKTQLFEKKTSTSEIPSKISRTTPLEQLLLRNSSMNFKNNL